MGEIVQVRPDGKEAGLNVVHDYSTAKVVTNHVGDFAVLSSEVKPSNEVNLATGGTVVYRN